MIKTRMGQTELKGNCAEIMADYTMLTCEMVDFLQNEMNMPKEKAKKELTIAFERGFAHAETIDEALDKMSEPIANIIIDVLKKVIEKKEGEK